MHRTTSLLLATLVAAVPAVADFRISPADGDSHSYPTVCPRLDGFVAAWETSGPQGRDVVLQRLDSDGRPIGGPQRANQEGSGDQQLPDIACRGDGSFLVVWESRGQDGDGLGIFARNFGADGSAVSNEFQVNTYTTDNQRRPRVCAGPGGEAVVVWDSFGQDGDGTGVYGQRFDSQSTPSGNEFQIHDITTANQSEPVVACADDGTTLIAWTNQRDDQTEVLARLLLEDGELDGRLPQVGSRLSTSTTHPTAAWLRGRVFILALQTSGRADLEIQRLSLPVEGEPILLGRTFPTDRRNEAPAIASAEDGEVLLAWSRGSGFAYDIAGFRFNALTSTNDRQTNGLVRNIQGNDGALSPLGRGIDIATADNGDLVVWQKRNVFAADSTSAIFAQRFNDCIGDCSDDGLVRVNELILGVRIALDQAALDACGRLDDNGNGSVEINELIRAVNEALASICPAPVG